MLSASLGWVTSSCTRSSISVKAGGGNRLSQHRELLLHRHDVERQTVDRDQHADRREQRQRGVEAATRGGERHLVGASASRSAPSITRRQRGQRDALPCRDGVVSNVDSASAALSVILAAENARHAGSRCGAATFSLPIDRDFGLRRGGRGPMSAPTQQRTCLWPSWLRNDVKRSGNRLVAGSFDRFVNSRPPPCSGGRPAKGRPGAMTPKIARFLAEQQPATPCLVLDVDRVEENFRALAARSAAGADLLRREGQSGPSRAGAAGAPRLQLRCRELRGGRRLPRRRRAAGGDQLRQHDQEGVGDPRGVRSAA